MSHLAYIRSIGWKASGRRWPFMTKRVRLVRLVPGDESIEVTLSGPDFEIVASTAAEFAYQVETVLRAEGPRAAWRQIGAVASSLRKGTP